MAGYGHEVRLLPAQYVRPYVRRSKTDRADAAALVEAVHCSACITIGPNARAGRDNEYLPGQAAPSGVETIIVPSRHASADGTDPRPGSHFRA